MSVFSNAMVSRHYFYQREMAMSPRFTSSLVLIASNFFGANPSASITSEYVPSASPSNQKSPNPSVAFLSDPLPSRMQAAPLTISLSTGS